MLKDMMCISKEEIMRLLNLHDLHYSKTKAANLCQNGKSDSSMLDFNNFDSNLLIQLHCLDSWS